MSEENGIIRDKEELLSYVRNRNEQQRNFSSIGESSETLPDEFSSYTGDGTDNYREGRQETQSDDGRDRRVESSERSEHRFIDQIRQFNSEPTRRDSSTNQYQSGVPGYQQPGRSEHATIGTTIKSKFQPFKKAADKLVKVATEKTGSTSKQKSATDGKRLSNVEAEQLRPKIVQTILWQTEHMDGFITATTKGHNPVEIWSTMDEAEAEIIADFMIARGKQNVQAAKIVRNMAVLMDRIKLGLITVPRAYRTIRYYIENGISIF